MKEKPLTAVEQRTLDKRELLLLKPDPEIFQQIIVTIMIL